MFDAIKSAPGVSPTSPSSGTVNTVAAFGSGGNENLFLVDGTNFTCPCAGVSRAEPSVDIIQEVQIQSVGVSAEYGNIQGTVFNVITRQGSNRFLYDASFYGQTSHLTAQPVLLSIPRINSRSGYSARGPATSPPMSVVQCCTIDCGSLPAISNCVTTTVNPVLTRTTRAVTSKTRSSAS